MIKKYKEQISYFIKSKKYIIPVIITFILSFGYTITHEAMGIDDISFDRYLNGGMYWLSQNRYGMWIIYNILNIKEFTPFWTDCITAILIAIIAFTICLFIRKNFSKIIKSDWVYTIFSCILISNPIINNFFTYQVSCLSVTVCNFISILVGIFIYEYYFNKQTNKFKLFCFTGIALSFAISTYESCSQTFLVFLFLSMFLKTISDEDKNKSLAKYFFFNIGILAIGVIIHYLINSLIHFILKQNGLLVGNYSAIGVKLFSKEFISGSWAEKSIILDKFFNQIISDLNKYFPITIFTTLFFITLIMELIHLLKTSNISRTLSFLGIIFSNFFLTIIQLSLLNRILFSLIITTAFLSAYIYNYFCTKKNLKYVINICAILLILYQTKSLNNYFYNDYRRYEREKMMANSIGYEILNGHDYQNKPIVFYIENPTKVQQKYGRIHKENSLSIIWWGIHAFDKPQEEAIKFVNYFGFSFKYPTEEQVENAYSEYENLNNDEKKNIVEFNDYIVINLNKYDMFEKYDGGK